MSWLTQNSNLNSTENLHFPTNAVLYKQPCHATANDLKAAKLKIGGRRQRHSCEIFNPWQMESLLYLTWEHLYASTNRLH